MLKFYIYCLFQWWKDRHIRREAEKAGQDYLDPDSTD
jgi:hypothetical protein